MEYKIGKERVKISCGFIPKKLKRINYKPNSVTQQCASLTFQMIVFPQAIQPAKRLNILNI